MIMTESNAGRFVWYELMTTDPKAAIAFYTEVVGWKTEAFEGSDYMMWIGGQGPLGGATVLPEAAKQMGAPPHWMANVLVDDVDKTAARVRELGGQVFAGPEDMPGVGRFAVIADPQGAVLSIFKPQSEMEPHDTEKHGEICWNELLTTDKKAAIAFYGDIFGWKTHFEHDMGPMGTYLIYGLGKNQFGGMFDKPADMPMPPAFIYYVRVDDLDAALARATKLGAKVANGPMEVPGGARIVQLFDPQGAMFALHEVAKSAS
ncbi:putative hydroxylase [Minicystis rosea]|nr:putative hydroxylase [Minicystis rosea]